MEPEGLLSCSQEPTVGLCREEGESSYVITTHFFKICFNISIPYNTPRSYKLSPSFRFSDENFVSQKNVMKSE
jgi:hypothetical protein